MTLSNAIVTNFGVSSTAETPRRPLDQKTARDCELIMRVLAGESDLFYELIRHYERRVFLAAVSILGNDADAEEAAAGGHIESLQASGMLSSGIKVQHLVDSDRD